MSPGLLRTVVAERQRSQVGEVAQVRRYRPAQLVTVEPQLLQVGGVLGTSRCLHLFFCQSCLRWVA